jgi:hypothetical protein
MSKYLKNGEREVLSAEIEKRRSLQAQAKKLKASATAIGRGKSVPNFRTHVVSGQALLQMAELVDLLGKRDCFSQLERYLTSTVTKRATTSIGT